MRRGLRPWQTRPTYGTNSMSKDLDWVLDQWKGSSEEVKLQLVLAKIRQEDKDAANEPKRAL